MLNDAEQLAIVGDMIGSIYERYNIKTKEFVKSDILKKLRILILTLKVVLHIKDI